MTISAPHLNGTQVPVIPSVTVTTITGTTNVVSGKSEGVLHQVPKRKIVLAKRILVATLSSCLSITLVTVLFFLMWFIYGLVTHKWVSWVLYIWIICFVGTGCTCSLVVRRGFVLRRMLKEYKKVNQMMDEDTRIPNYNDVKVMEYDHQTRYRTDDLQQNQSLFLHPSAYNHVPAVVEYHSSNRPDTPE